MADPETEVAAEAPPEPKAKKAKAKKPESAGKDKKGKKDKKDKKGGAGDSARLSVASHPRASVQVRRAKAWGGLISFGLAAVISAKAGVPTVDLGARALMAGVAGYIVAWGCSV